MREAQKVRLDVLQNVLQNVKAESHDSQQTLLRSAKSNFDYGTWFYDVTFTAMLQLSVQTWFCGGGGGDGLIWASLQFYLTIWCTQCVCVMLKT